VKGREAKVVKVSDHVTAKEDVQVIRYKGSVNIKDLMKNKMYIEAFVHTQLGIEKILWDGIVSIFEPTKARAVRTTINHSKSLTKTVELIKWANYLGAINHDEYADLMDFNKKRNRVMHVHGKWWDVGEEESNREALRKGIRFLEKNGM
jgi:hypothetical protein